MDSIHSTKPTTTDGDMNAKAEARSDHPGIYAALAAAQMEMGRALKSTDNPHFRSKFADLAEVVAACRPALNAHGIAIFQPLREIDGKLCAVTILAHVGGETLECPVPLLVQKHDMQGLGSAITYARRYGLMAMAGIAPEDDDGNAAAAAAPRGNGAERSDARISADQFVTLREMIEAAGADEAKFLAFVGAPTIEEMTVRQFDTAVAALRKKIGQRGAA